MPGSRSNGLRPRLSDLFNIAPPATWAGPSPDFTHQLEYEDLAQDARKVLADLTPVEREISSSKGGHYIARIRPYRALVDDKIADGVVTTFVDVTEKRRMEDALRAGEEELEKQNGDSRSKRSESKRTD